MQPAGVSKSLTRSGAAAPPLPGGVHWDNPGTGRIQCFRYFGWGTIRM